MSESYSSERWLPVVGYEGFYSVSDHGRVRQERAGKNTSAGRILKPYIRNVPSRPRNRYRVVSLIAVKTRKARPMQVQCLVLEAFIGPRPDGYEARHLNGNGEDNHVSNLAWGTRKENYADQRRHGVAAIGSKHGSAKLTEASVREIRALHRILKWPVDRIAAAYGVSGNHLRKVISGIYWSHVSCHG